jgi:Na+-driven multidrug efflux pump
LLGPVAAAAYNLTFQLGFATTQICESVAVAVQTLLAREIADDKSRPAQVRKTAVRHLIKGSILVGGFVASGLSLLTYFQQETIIQGLTSNPSIRAASLAIFPAVLATQGTNILHTLF